MLNLDPSREIIGYLVRHGELKKMNIWDGWGDFDLSETGRESAEKAAQWLSFEKIGRVISSDIPRAVETAQCIMDTCDVACPFMSCDPNLRPRMVADFTGKEKTPERVAEFKKYIEDPDLVIPGGESGTQLNQRVQVIYQYLATPYKALPTVCAIHNSVIKSLLGIDEVGEIVDPGGIIAVYMDEKGAISFEVVMGAAAPTSSEVS
jgi:broad specificity phosphatase PhoE